MTMVLGSQQLVLQRLISITQNILPIAPAKPRDTTPLLHGSHHNCPEHPKEHTTSPYALSARRLSKRQPNAMHHHLLLLPSIPAWHVQNLPSPSSTLPRRKPRKQASYTSQHRMKQARKLVHPALKHELHNISHLITHALIMHDI